jgi:hypothetical protein
MLEGAISFPREDEFEQENQLIIAQHPLLFGAFGSVDGLALPAQTAEDLEVENATYNTWKASHFISNILAFSPKGQFNQASMVFNIFMTGIWVPSFQQC